MKMILTLIKNKDKTFVDFLFKRYSKQLTNLGYYVYQHSYSYLPFERDDFYSLAYQTCNELWKVNEETIEKNGIEKILKMQMIQKVILLTRKHKTQGNYVLNNSVHTEEYINDTKHYTEIDMNKIEVEHIIKNNQKRIKKFNEIAFLIFNDYFIENLTRKEISKKLNLPIKVVNQKINYLKKVIKEKFIR